MKIQSLKILPFVLAATIIMVACGGGGEQNTAAAQSAESEPEKTQTPSQMTPTEIGLKIGKIYATAMKDVTEYLKNKPAVPEAKAKVEAMKEECIQQLVELGRLREALDEAGRASVDSQVRMKANSLYNEPWYATYNEIQQHYFQDRDFHKTVISFNIITQYAAFDLLKKQEPEEAKRLGIQ